MDAQEYLDKRIAEVDQQAKEMLATYSAELRGRLEIFLEEKIRSLQAVFAEHTGVARVRFDLAMEELKRKKKEGTVPAILLEYEEKSIQMIFEMTIDGHKNILDAGVAGMRRALESYRG